MEIAAVEKPDAVCIRQCQRGRREAFEPLVRRYGPWAFHFALGMVHDPETARDLSQEAFIRVFRAMGRLDPSRPFRPWLHTILYRLCVSHIRRQRRWVNADSLRDDLPGFDGRELVRRREREELRKLVHQAMARLSPRDQEVLVLRQFQELSYAEIAETLGIPRGTVMSRLHHARRRLRRALEDILRGNHSTRTDEMDVPHDV